MPDQLNVEARVKRSRGCMTCTEVGKQYAHSDHWQVCGCIISRETIRSRDQYVQECVYSSFFSKAIHCSRDIKISTGRLISKFA